MLGLKAWRLLTSAYTSRKLHEMCIWKTKNTLRTATLYVANGVSAEHRNVSFLKKFALKQEFQNSRLSESMNRKLIHFLFSLSLLSSAAHRGLCVSLGCVYVARLNGVAAVLPF